MDPQPIGRDTEIAAICSFLSATSGAPAALAITGNPGIGKTVVWKHMAQAAGRTSRVLACQPAQAERLLAFSALDDLFGDVAEEILPALPGPRRLAVEVALLREPSPGPAGADGRLPGRRVLARGALDMMRALSEDSPLVVAVDDAQWLDRPTAGVLEFCLRRLHREPVSILLTFRTSDPVPLGLDRALPPDRLKGVPLGPLSLGAIGEILRSRLGAVLPRYTMTRLHEACGGNPFYALEYARALLDHPHTPVTSEPLPLPPSLGDLVRYRVRRLSPDARRAAWLVAASANPGERLIRAACSDQEAWAAIDQAIDAGIVERDGELLRFTHPLLRSVLYGEMTPDQRREVHQRLGAAAEDAEERAWHLALAADRPSERIAGLLDGAAAEAASRGAPEAAAALAEQATRLTPNGRSHDAGLRRVRAADYHFYAGDMARSRELIGAALTACPPGPRRAALLLRLATIHYHQNGWPLAEQTFRQAAEEAAGEAALCAHAEQELAFARMVAGDLPAALHWAKTSLRSGQRAADPHLMAHSLARLAVFGFLQGNGARHDLLDSAEALSAAAGQVPAGRLPLYGPALLKGVILKWSDRLDEARMVLAEQYRNTLDCGDEASLAFLLYHFSELECWAGNWDAAEEYALEGRRVTEESRQQAIRPAALYSLALVRAHRGDVAQARELAGEALAMCERTRNVPFALQALSVLGFAALSLGDHQTAVSHLDRLAEASAAFGLGEPGVVRFLPDEIEALAAVGEVDRAWSFTRQLEARGRSLGRPWALATAARCRAHLAAGCGDLQQARDACEQALSLHEKLPMPFELGRTLLVKGMIERRGRRKSEARATFGEALGLFAHLGAALWADKARQELSKIAAHSSVDGLTETERRIAALIAQGRTNREVAGTMFVTENTVQTHLRHIFRKLGVRSRTELAARHLHAPAGATAATRPAAGPEPGLALPGCCPGETAVNITDSRDSSARARNYPDAHCQSLRRQEPVERHMASGSGGRQPHDPGKRACPARDTPKRAAHHQADITPLCRDPGPG